MGMNALFELDENDPDRFNLSRGLTHHLEGFLSSFLYMVALVILLFIWIGVMIWKYIIINIIKFFIPSSK
jgi:hypothetical protein